MYKYDHAVSVYSIHVISVTVIILVQYAGRLRCSISTTVICCRRRLGGLLCDLLVMPGFPAGLTSPLLVEQKRIWPQESYRCVCVGGGGGGGGGGAGTRLVMTSLYSALLSLSEWRSLQR